MIGIAIFVFFLFRRALLQPFIGAAGICVLDAVVGVILAAWWFAAPIPNWPPLLCYAFGVVTTLLASHSVVEYHRLTGGDQNVTR